MSRFRGPVRRSKGGFSLHLSDDEVALIRRLLGELDALMADAADPEGSHEEPAALRRLFPVAHPDDPELEAEYQRLMRSELIASRREAIQEVERMLTAGSRIDAAELTAFMQSVNAVRLVLGSMLDVSDDPDRDEIAPGAGDSPEYHLYAYLSWLLEWTVQALAGDL